jgi:hypothetical protein
VIGKARPYRWLTLMTLIWAGNRRRYRGFTRMSADQEIARNAKIAEDRRNWKAKKPLKRGGTEEAEEWAEYLEGESWRIRWNDLKGWKPCFTLPLRQGESR